MPVRFVIGRAGTGKSRRCFNAIVEALRADPLGTPIFLIVPKQATFTAERELACASGLDGFCRARVVSFESLGDDILAECGGDAVPLVTTLGRQMILGHLLRKHEAQLRYFKSVARQSGLAAELDATFAEFERCGKSAKDLAGIVADFESSASADHHDQALVSKLHDLKLLYDAYTAYLGQDRLDQHRRLSQVLESLESCRQVQQSTIYVDGFLELTEYERRMLASLAKVCRAMEISLLLDPSSKVLSDPHHIPDELNLLHRTEDTYRRLWFAFEEEAVEIDETIVLNDPTRFANGALSYIEKNLVPRGKVATTPVASQEKIALIEAPDRRSEVDAAARQVRALLEQADFRFRDIAILTRDLDDYHELIDASFREHAIPFFVDRRRAAAHHPLLQLTRAIFLVALHDWPHDALMTIGKSGLASLSLDQVDDLENYVIQHRIRGGGAWTAPEAWSFRRSLTRSSDNEEISDSLQRVALQRIDALRRRLAEPLVPFVTKLQSSRRSSIRDIVIELFNLFARLNVPGTLLVWMNAAFDAGQIERHDEHQQVWTELVELFDQMVDLLGDELVSADEFLEILESGLERFDLALTPPTVDQVIVGEVERTRNVRPRATIVLGLNDGQFPRLGREGSILSDVERRAMRKRNLDLDPDTSRRLLDENLLAYLGFTRASERLTLTRSLADDERRPQAPSTFWRRMRELFPTLVPMRIARSEHSLGNIGTPRQLVATLMRWARTNPDGDEVGCPTRALYNWFASHPCDETDRDPIDAIRRLAWRALSYANDARLSPDVASRLFASPLRASVSRLETFATCPFKHFVSYGLKLETREDDQVTALDLGNVYHSILEKIVKEMLRTRIDLAAHTPDQAKQLIAKYAQEVGRELRGELMLSSARNKYLLNRIERTLARVMASHQAFAKRGRLRPWKAELHFGLGGDDEDSLPAMKLKTPNGATIELVGKIDRVDRIADEAAFAVIDYKLRGNTLDLARVYHGLSLQLLTYLIVLQASGKTLEGKPLTPAAAFYVRLLRTIESVKHPDEGTDPDDPLYDLKERPRGVIDGRFVDAFDTQLEAGKSEVVQVHVKKDGGFGRRNATDVAQGVEFDALLERVRRKLGELADQLLAGDVSVAPYRLHRQSPCPQCDYRSICRFDVAINRYRPLASMNREQVLGKVVEEARDAR